VVGDLPEFHKEDFTTIFEGIIYPTAGAQVLFGTWGGATSNQNAFVCETTANQGLQFYILSQAGGGSIHLNRVTGANTVRPGDHITVIWRRAGTNSKIYVHRRERFPGDIAATLTFDDTISGTPNSGPGADLLTVGAYIGTASGFLDMDVGDLAIVARSITDDEVAAFQTWADGRYDFPFVSYASSRALVIGVDLGTGAGGGADDLHPNDAGHAKIGQCMWDNQQALTASLGLTGGVARIATCGDSRMDGFNSTANNTTGRAVRAALAAGASYTDTPVGPASGKGGNTFALSGMLERATSRAPANKGFSHRSPGTNSVDVYMGPGGLYRDVDVAHFLLGVNNIGAAGPFMDHDIMFERLLTAVYMRDQVLSAAGHAIGFSFLTEPSSAVTTTGWAQRIAFAFNRELHALVAKLRELGIPAEISNIHDDSYYP
jgi:hypothetical protein